MANEHNKSAEATAEGRAFALFAMPDFSAAVPTIKAAAIAAGKCYSGNFSSSNASSLNVSSTAYVEGNANLSGVSFSGKGSIYVKGKITITGSSTNFASDSSICM